MGQPDLSAVKHIRCLVCAGLTLMAGICTLGLSAAQGDIINPASFYPEGAFIQDGQLLYAEMPQDRIMMWDGTANSVFWTRRGCGPTSIAPRGQTHLLIACHIDNFVVELQLDAHGKPAPNTRVKRHTINRPNDTISDAKGGTYISSSGEFSKRLRKSGAIYYLSPAGELRQVARDIWYANGLVIGPDGDTLFVSEHLGGRILAFDIAPDGSLSGKRPYIDIANYADTTNPAVFYIGPDGLTVDQAGRLYVCIYGAGEILVFNKNRTLEHRIPVGGQYVTNIDLSEDERTLYITAPAENDTADLSGAVFALPNPVK